MSTGNFVQMWVSWCILVFFYRWHLEHSSVLWNTWWWQGVTHTQRAWGGWKCTLCVFKPSKCLSTYTSELYLSLQGNTMDQHYFCLHTLRMNTKHTQMNGKKKKMNSYAQSHTRLHGWGQHNSNTNRANNQSSVVVTRTRQRNDTTLVCVSCSSVGRTCFTRARGQDNHDPLRVGDRIKSYSWKGRD